MTPTTEFTEIRWHGRGGQGAVTSAELVAQAAISEGKYAQAFPSFGPERRGAPVSAFVRISKKEPIRVRAGITEPDVVVVLDPGLLHIANVTSGLKEKGGLIMKIAVATDDGTTVSQHFGKALSYVVITVEDGQVSDREKRDKTGHHTFAGQQNKASHTVGAGHGYGTHAESKHASMVQSIADCQVLIAGGMGLGAYHSLKNRNIEPVITDVKDIDEAVKLYLSNDLPNLMERLH